MKTTTADLIKKIRDKFGIEDNTAYERYAPMVAELASKGCYVYHVVSGRMNVFGESVFMDSYCYVTDEDGVDTLTDLADGYAMTYTDNKTWDIQEHGGIAFEMLGNSMIRIG